MRDGRSLSYTFTDMLDRVRITAAVQRALEFIGDADDRRTLLREFLAQLKADPRWNDDEVVTVQSRVLRSLAQKAWA